MSKTEVKPWKEKRNDQVMLIKEFCPLNKMNVRSPVCMDLVPGEKISMNINFQNKLISLSLEITRAPNDNFKISSLSQDIFQSVYHSVKNTLTFYHVHEFENLQI